MIQNKCSFEGCKKKLKTVDKIMGLCRCENVFCKIHRLPEQHNCSFQFIINKDEFIRENKCVAIKVEKA